MAVHEVSDRPNLESMIDRYDAMLAEMRAEIAAVRSRTNWYEADHAGRGPGPSDSPAVSEVAFSPTWAFFGALVHPGGVRSEVLDALGEVGARYGFSDPVVFVDRPDEFQVVAEDMFGAEYRFGSSRNTTLSYITGPHPILAQEGGGA